MSSSVLTSVLVADEVWIATALLHRENPNRPDFRMHEIVGRAAEENLHGSLRAGVKVHVSLHCVANKAPNPGRHRMLYATGRHTRRLYRPGDICHPERTGKIVPNRNEIPERYGELLDWYESEYKASISGSEPDSDPILALRGAGCEIRSHDEHPDDWVRRLREGWQ